MLFLALVAVLRSLINHIFDDLLEAFMLLLATGEAQDCVEPVNVSLRVEAEGNFVKLRVGQVLILRHFCWVFVKRAGNY